MRPIATSKNGLKVYDRLDSHLHRGVQTLVRDVLKTKVLDESIVKICHTFDKVIGKTYCVPVTEKDQLSFQVRPGRKGLSHIVENRQPEPCKSVVIILKQIQYGYVIITAYISEPAPPEPWNRSTLEKDARGYKEALNESLDFWSFHALIKE